MTLLMALLMTCATDVSSAPTLRMVTVDVAWRDDAIAAIRGGLPVGSRVIDSYLSSPLDGMAVAPDFLQKKDEKEDEHIEAESAVSSRKAVSSETAGNSRGEPAKVGWIAWMVRHRVAPNILMVFLLLGGILAAFQVKQEVFPEFDLDIITVRVPYPGASPAEVEQGIVLVVEEAVRGIAGIKETSIAAESIGTVTAELSEGVDRQRVFQDIQQAVERVTTFPQQAEDPVVSIAGRVRRVMQVQVFGDVSPMQLRSAAEMVRESLLAQRDISKIDLSGVRDFEVRVEISQAALQRYNLSLQQVSTIIQRNAIELPSGSIDTDAGEILMRLSDRRDWAADFAQLPIISQSGGGVVTLEDIATLVTDDFEDSDSYATYNAQPAIGLEVMRIGDQKPTDVAAAVREVMTEVQLPATIQWVISDDRTVMFTERAQLMLKNAAIGLCLVLILLGVFLEIKLAFWVTMGILVSFTGAFLLLPGWGVSINMVSMFAFIIALGIVVDDAIIVGENIHEQRQRGFRGAAAAIRGAKDIAIPVLFAVLTNIIAFVPLLLVPGAMGKIFMNIPAVVISVFAISLVESLFILPAHLAHQPSAPRRGFSALIHRFQQRFAAGLANAIQDVFWPIVTRSAALALCGVSAIGWTLFLEYRLGLYWSYWFHLYAAGRIRFWCCYRAGAFWFTTGCGRTCSSTIRGSGVCRRR